MLPQWALNTIRPVVGAFSRVFWKIEFRGVENVPERGGVERVELRAGRRVDAVGTGSPVTERRVGLRVRGFDAREVGLEGDGRVILSVGRRAGE